MWYALLMLLSTQTMAGVPAVTLPPFAPPPFVEVRPSALSSSAILEGVVWNHYREERVCWKPARGLPLTVTVKRHIRGIVAASGRWWPGEEWAMYRLLVILLSEGDGHMNGNSPPKERTYGPYCATLEEVRSTCSAFPDLKAPRANWEAKEKLGTDPEWAALIAAGTLWRYDLAQGGDRIRGTLMYKMGAEGLRRALESVPIMELRVWKQTRRGWDRVLCLRDRVILNNTVMCGCEAP
jgi:hypothetical protein